LVVKASANSTVGRLGAMASNRSATALAASCPKKFDPAKTTKHRERAKMADYDSDSSNEGENYTETNVLLGYATQDATGDAVSHLGGVPVNITTFRIRTTR
jgi:hypothetical protein